MELLGLEYSETRYATGRDLPPKVLRVVMLDMFALPVTNYTVIDTRNVSMLDATRTLQAMLVASPHGIVLRTASHADVKGDPYCWVHECSALPRALASIPTHIVMAFAPKATPTSAADFAVGRWLSRPDGSMEVEYISNEIRPRALDKIKICPATHHCFGSLRKRPGEFLRAQPISRLSTLLSVSISEYAGHLLELESFLKTEKCLGPMACLCLEFTFDRRAETIEFHDFDF